jgi:AraC-like DNA-binding protein
MGDSFLFSGPGHDSQSCRHSVSLLCAMGDQQLEVRCDRRTLRSTMLMVAPLEAKTLLASGVPFVLMDVEPSHRHFRVLAAACRNSGVETLPDESARAFREMAQAFHAGTLTGTDADRAARESIDTLAATWPAPPALDPRVRRMQKMMDLQPAITLHEMAVKLGLSDSAASRLFSRDMGIAQRIYSLAIKIRAASQYMGSGLSLTEIGQDAGFVDSAHFAKVWTRCYGAPPFGVLSSASARGRQRQPARLEAVGNRTSRAQARSLNACDRPSAMNRRAMVKGLCRIASD